MPFAKAIQPGFYGGSLREPGAIFEIEDGATGSWFDVIDSASKVEKPKAQKAKGGAPKTFSEIADQDAKAMTPKGLDEQ